MLLLLLLNWLTEGFTTSRSTQKQSLKLSLLGYRAGHNQDPPAV